MLQEATQAPTVEPSTSAILSEFVDGIVVAVPRLLSGLLFLVLAYLTIKLVLAVVRSVVDRLYRDEEQLIVDLVVTVVGIFLWFGATLGLLKVVGLGDVAASLGTASGFIGLGVAFALKEMIADTVAGVYLLQDEDFSEGDRVETASVTGRLVSIDLRKTRIETDEGNLVVVANRDVEKRWTRHARADQDLDAGR
ncbi:mechanosensitive ion channel domain-containing protein [Halomicrobium sp. HM KBTZ05]|uniref:Mechanosensitive ion channel n=1 Tax=Halomicrobium mukohataei TaxID=57705 RepID=A0A847UC39_9EURY|nr:mechanosensitive ion channel domain-containing protein [Halomicrobium mukohataei]NLV08844.1 mechanosensitive ion channel [Halomicrobium mukohataei]